MGDDMGELTAALDDEAIRAIRTVILLEYARCTKTPGDVVIKSFNGLYFTGLPQNRTALRVGKRNSKRKE